MSALKELENAIGAHGLWKARLRDAIDTGKSEFDPDTVKSDKNCDFGKWLYGEISPELKISPLYNKVVQLHAEFHAEAGKVLKMAITGNKEEAQTGMKGGSRFSSLSASLTSAMIEWKKSFK